ncbi:hypothetical protein [Paenibacillus antri]|uniref:hypothetical protein n=1 Tax=Paenibacillus antri TaxID=2582848 RepID=UPI00192E6147|nr:hypothetical protein [Paenibacillus antri]
MNRLLLASLGTSLLLLNASCSFLEPTGGHKHDAASGAPAESGHAHHGGGKAAHGAPKASFAFPDGAPAPGKSTTLTIGLRDEAGAVIDKFDVNHEKLMHLIVVSEDLSHFEHLHPEYEWNGTFRVDLTFPAGGRHKLFADFVPSGGAQTTIGEWIDVEGEGAGRPVVPEAELAKTIDGKRIELDIAGLSPNADAMLTFSFKDAPSGRPIDDLEPYLGAVGHVVILSEDAETYLHVHPADEASTGPEATFHTSFPSSGTYKIWGQFQHQGRLITVPFVVNVTK